LVEWDQTCMGSDTMNVPSSKWKFETPAVYWVDSTLIILFTGKILWKNIFTAISAANLTFREPNSYTRMNFPHIKRSNFFVHVHLSVFESSVHVGFFTTQTLFIFILYLLVQLKFLYVDVFVILIVSDPYFSTTYGQKVSI